MLKRFLDGVLNNPKSTLLGILALTVVACIGYKNVWLANDYKLMFDKDAPLLIAMNEQEATYAKSDNIVIAVAPKQGDIFQRETLQAIYQLTEAGWKAPYSSRVDSITNYNHSSGDDDQIIVKQLLENPAQLSDSEIQAARDIILTSAELSGLYVARDGKAAIINITFQLPANPLSENPEIGRYIDNLVSQQASIHPQLDYHVTGSVANANAFTDAMQEDMFTLIPASYAVMVILLLLLTRSAMATLITLTVVTFTTLFTMGVKCWLDGSINAINMFAPIMMMTIAVADAVHLLTSFLQEYRKGHSKKAAMRASLEENFNGVLLTSLTTIFGFLSLNFHDSPPYQELGNLVAFGVAWAWVLVLTLLPALVMLLPFKQTAPESRSSRSMLRLVNFTIRHPRSIVLGGVLVAGVLLAGLPRNEFNEMYTRYLDDSFSFRRANDFINSNVTGLHRLMYSVDSGEANGVHDPAYQKRLEDFSNWLRAQPEVAHVGSYTDVVKRLNQAVNSNAAAAYQLPASRELASQYSLLYELSLPYGMGLTNIVSLDKRQSLVMASVWETDTKTIMALNQRAETWLQVHTPAPMHAKGAGLDLMFSTMMMNNISSMIYGTFFSMLLISGVLLIALRSLRLGILSVFANLLPATMAFGLWGYLNGHIGIGVAAVAQLSLGLVVDDTIHFLSRYNKLTRAGMSVREAVLEVHASTGMAMLTTTLLFAGGFGVLAFSHYTANADMGLLTAITLLIAVAVDLIVLPAWLVWRHGEPHTSPTSSTPTAATDHASAPQTTATGVAELPEPAAGVLGHLPLLSKGQGGCFYDAMRQLQQSHGDIFRLNILGKPWVVLSDLELIYQVLVTDREKFPKAGDAVDEMKAIGGDLGILVTEGQQWLRQRQISMPAFRHEQLQAMVGDMNAIALRAVNELAAAREVEAREFSNRIALAIICQVGFDYRLESLAPGGASDPILEAEEVACQELMKRIQRTKYWKQLPLPANYRLDRLLLAQRRIFEEIIRERREGQGEAKVLLDQFLRATDENGSHLNDEELLQMVHNFIAAGHETTGTLLHWVLYYLATHPELQDQVRAEIDQVVGAKEQIDYADLRALVTLDKVVKETLRLRPPIPIMLRSAGEESVLGGYRIPQDSVLMVMIGSVQSNPAYWGNNADFFDPENFSAKNEAARTANAFSPFGIGPRLCIGHRFTMLEAGIVLAQLIRNYRFEWIPGQDMRPVLRLVWTTHNGIRFKITPLTRRTEPSSFVMQAEELSL